MHSPMYMYETEVQDRVSSYHWQAKLGHPEKQAKAGWVGSWLDTMQSNLRHSLSHAAAATKRTAVEMQSWIAKPAAPKEQCC